MSAFSNGEIVHKIFANLKESYKARTILRNYIVSLQKISICTNLGREVKFLNTSSYSIVFDFSQKLMPLYLVTGGIDENEVIGNILKTDYIEVVLIKELDSVYIVSFDPKTIRYNPKRKKSYILLLNAVCSSINSSLRLLKFPYQLLMTNPIYNVPIVLGINENFKTINMGKKPTNTSLSFHYYNLIKRHSIRHL